MARFTMFYLAFFVVCLAARAFAEPPERIVGGSRAAVGEFPYQVSIRVGNQHTCGGTIISSRHILTAAHCVNDWNAPISFYTVVTGTNSLNYGGEVHGISSVSVHPSYIGSQQTSWINDVAVIALRSPITFNSLQKAIPLLDSEVPNGSLLSLSGWGKIATNGPLSNALLKTYLYAEDYRVCQQQHTIPIYPSQICALNRAGIGACQGDSGGPLTYNGRIAGIVSWVIPCARGIPDVFTKVSAHLNFIRNAVQST
ncbi:PREDICTED: chymotrypsin-1-like [Polistes dominula]|uniref:Chymotrypsin-1-like n=1 Tax=Polistes dominula TaxID=743375 RepID=A0ABM1I7Q1_POLDO|nr:PREDICTED: chymotrypsin-1-like [Polistes dominula]